MDKVKTLLNVQAGCAFQCSYCGISNGWCGLTNDVC